MSPLSLIFCFLKGFGFVTFEADDAVDEVCSIQYHDIRNKKVILVALLWYLRKVDQILLTVVLFF